MYSPRAEDLRRCLARTKAGERCKSWAVWGDPQGACYAHGGRPAKGHPAGPSPCTCAAYKWPHRPGGGLCRWPDPPYARSRITASTHRERRRSDAFYRSLLGGFWLGGHGLSEEVRRELQEWS
jgi:hypothetical protein